MGELPGRIVISILKVQRDPKGERRSDFQRNRKKIEKLFVFEDLSADEIKKMFGWLSDRIIAE